MRARCVRTLCSALSASVLMLACAVGTAPGWAAGAESVLDRVLTSHTLRVCTTGDYRPFSFLRDDGSYEGLDIELVGRLAQALGAQVQYVATSWPHLIQDFQAGKCELAAGGISVSLERQKQAAFSSPYLVDGKWAIARCTDAARFDSLSAIDEPGVRVIENPGGTNERFARTHLKNAQLHVHTDNLSVFAEIIAGRADVMITDHSETLLQHKLHAELCPVHLDRPLQYGEKAYLVPQGDAAFKDYVDQWLHLEQSNGTLDATEGAWLR